MDLPIYSTRMNHMKSAVFVSLLLLLILHLPLAYANDQIAGSIKNIEGNAYVIRNGDTISATKGEKLYQGDILVTKNDSAMGVILRDDTLISLGSDTRISIEEFRFIPAKNDLSLVTRMMKGIITYISGQIAKISPESARFETPVATIGVRGTKFLVKIEE